jgi:hypothetical protein
LTAAVLLFAPVAFTSSSSTSFSIVTVALIVQVPHKYFLPDFEFFKVHFVVLDPESGCPMPDARRAAAYRGKIFRKTS